VSSVGSFFSYVNDARSPEPKDPFFFSNNRSVFYFSNSKFVPHFILAITYLNSDKIIHYFMGQERVVMFVCIPL